MAAAQGLTDCSVSLSALGMLTSRIYTFEIDLAQASEPSLGAGQTVSRLERRPVARSFRLGRSGEAGAATTA